MKNDISCNYVDEDGNVYILGEFDESIQTNVIDKLVKKINYLESLSSSKNNTITFYINSNGGYCDALFSLLALIEIAKQKGIKIQTIVLGYAYSAASLLAIHGDHRSMFKYGQHLMHLGEHSSSVTTFAQFKRVNEAIKDHFDNIVEMYVEHTKIPEDKVREILKDDQFYISAKQCKKMGLVDEIIGEEEK